MLTSSGYSAISPVAPANAYRTGTERGRRAAAAKASTKYDSVTLSGLPTKESRFRMELAGRLTQEVRTATTTGDIHALRQQVSEGTYVPDPMAIAARMMLLGEG